MILLSTSKAWLWVQRDGGIWSFLTWTRYNFVLLRHPEVSLEVLKVETLLILLENLFDLLLELGAPVSRWMFSVPTLRQQILFVHLRLEIWISHFLWEILLPLHWVFLGRFYDASIVSNSSRSATSTSPFQIHPAYNAFPRNNPGKTYFIEYFPHRMNVLFLSSQFYVIHIHR